MKRKGPKKFNFEEWIIDYCSILPQEWAIDKKGRKAIKNIQVSTEMHAKRKEILDYLLSNSDVFKKFEDLTVEYSRLIEFYWPTVYTLVVKASSELNDREYVNARVFWPMPHGKKKEMRFYVCPLSDDLKVDSVSFKNNMYLKVSKEIKKRKMANQLELSCSTKTDNYSKYTSFIIDKFYSSKINELEKNYVIMLE